MRLLLLLLLQPIFLGDPAGRAGSDDGVLPGAPPNALRVLAVPLPQAKAARASFAEELAPLLSKLRPSREAQTYVLDEAGAVLRGDLFGTGTCFAFLETPGLPKDVAEDKQARQVLVERSCGGFAACGESVCGGGQKSGRPIRRIPMTTCHSNRQTISVGGGPPGLTGTGNVDIFPRGLPAGAAQ